MNSDFMQVAGLLLTFGSLVLNWRVKTEVLQMKLDIRDWTEGKFAPKDETHRRLIVLEDRPSNASIRVQ